jgi:DNA repair exonuclease SbcCD ATPase subunit
MKTTLTTLTLIAAGLLLTGCGGDRIEEFEDRQLALQEELADILEGIDDRDDAEAAADRLDDLKDEYDDLQDEMDDYREEIEETFEDRRDDVQERLEEAMEDLSDKSYFEEIQDELRELRPMVPATQGS